jgi:hypothetical protein
VSPARDASQRARAPGPHRTGGNASRDIHQREGISKATHDITHGRGATAADSRPAAPSGLRRLATETKAAFKTTEFYAFLAVLAGLLIAGNTIEGKDGGADYFAADKIWLYVTLLTIGYMISRGLAKAGSRDPYWDERGDRNASH